MTRKSKLSVAPKTTNGDGALPPGSIAAKGALYYANILRRPK